MKKLTTEKFINYNRNLEMYNPMNREKGISLKDIILGKVCNAGYNGLIKFTTYDKILEQCVQHIYAYNNTLFTTEIIEVLRRYETYPTLWRSCYYRDTKSKLKIIGIFDRDRGEFIKSEKNNSDNWMILDSKLEETLTYDFIELNNISNIITRDNTLKYCGYMKKSKIDMLDYIKLYREHPLVEVPMKLGLYKFILNPTAIETIEGNKYFRKWICKNKDECQDLSFKVIFNSFKKNPNASVKDYSNSLKYRIQCGRNLSNGLKELYKDVLNYTTQEKLMKYINEQETDVNTYGDYIEACMWFNLDLSDTKVLFPYDFYEMHDLYTEQYFLARNPNYLNISNKMENVAKKFEFLEYCDEKYVLKIAKNKLEVIEESRVLSHCVGYMDYDVRQANEESLICFIRKVDNVDEPFCTLELSLIDFKVKQCYGKNNCIVLEVDDFVNTWHNQIKNKLKKMVQSSN